ncbi:caspase-1, p20 [Cereibacter sphaeroides]|uniref:caspase family protein n=1 Tax=Cereibacter sphaeroides TaxID=1063 RepID=UPI000F53EC94|nr:caspase family protein [Cereibacter sphaeroides]AZB65661.1 caspase-1, p20 [Cereibacter sphaeroides]AZB70417.1 caspase-1, p20 [Cereibacter sphaeroides]
MPGAEQRWPARAALLLVLIAAAGLARGQETPSGPPPRVAMVVGNSAYQNVPALPNPAGDAELVAEKLWESGFEVIETVDADRETMLADLATFRSRLREGSEALFFYAGHGVQIGGRNYLLPVSVAPSSVEDLKAQAIDAQLFLDVMAQSGARLTLVLLDACRNNPFLDMPSDGAEAIATRALSIGASRAAVERGLRDLAAASRGGLAEMSAGRGEALISFATAPGQVAFDGRGRHSPYTSALAGSIDEPGLELVDLFRRVRGAVREATGGQQIAWTASTLESRFYFKPPADDLRSATTGMSTGSDTLGALPPRRVVDRTFWRAIRDTDRLDAFTAYVRTMPDGAFVAEAKEKIRSLGGDPEAIPVSDLSLPERPRGFVLADPAAQADLAATLDRAPASVPIGTGAARIGAAPDRAGWVHVAAAPRLGAVSAGGTRLEAGSVRWMEADQPLDYLPGIGSNGGLDSLRAEALREGGTTEPLEAAVETYVDACDMLAGNPYDSQRVTAGTRQFILDRNHDAAIAVCEIAVARHPEVVRFWAELARGYRAAGRYEEALHWQQKAVDAGYASAMVYLGQMYLDGQAVPRDFDRARELFEAADARGETAALTALAWIHRAGVGVPEDPARALDFYRQGAARGNDWAMTNIGEFYQKGLSVARDPVEAVRWYTAAAKSGELTAQTRLARMYQTGDGIAVDEAQARFWFETAAGRGVPNALTRLGLMYEQGQGVDRDLEAAARLYGRAAAEGDAEAWLRLGRLEASDAPLFDRPERALPLLEKALAAQVPGAARELGRLYETGRGVTKDLARARALYVQEAGANPWAARDAGRAFASDEGAPADPAQAARWYRVAAEGGVPWAALDLGRLYETGRGVPQDRTEALVLYAAAARPGGDARAAEAARRAAAGYSAEEKIRAAQLLLGRLGAEVGAPDGRMGPATRDALARVFAAHGQAPPGTRIDFDLLAELSAMDEERLP